MFDARKLLAAVVLLGTVCATQAAEPGLIAKRSAYSVGETLDRLERIVTDNGFTVFARIDHAAGAAKVGASLRPTQLLIFGNPKAGTPLIASAQSIGLDLPIRVLAWEDEEKQAWLGYQAPRSLADRHGVQGQDALIDKMTAALDRFTTLAAKLAVGDVSN